MVDEYSISLGCFNKNKRFTLYTSQYHNLRFKKDIFQIDTDKFLVQAEHEYEDIGEEIRFNEFNIDKELINELNNWA